MFRIPLRLPQERQLAQPVFAEGADCIAQKLRRKALSAVGRQQGKVRDRTRFFVQPPQGDCTGRLVLQAGDDRSFLRRNAQRVQKRGILRLRRAIPEIHIAVILPPPPALAADGRDLLGQMGRIKERFQPVSAVFIMQGRNGSIFAVPEFIRIASKKQTSQRVL